MRHTSRPGRHALAKVVRRGAGLGLFGSISFSRPAVCWTWRAGICPW